MFLKGDLGVFYCRFRKRFELMFQAVCGSSSHRREALDLAIIECDLKVEKTLQPVMLY